MLVAVTAAAGNLLNLEGRIFQQFLCRSHAAADEDIDKSFSCILFHASAQVVGADIQHGAEGNQGKVLVHVMLLDELQGALAQGGGAFPPGALAQAHAPARFHRPVERIQRLAVCGIEFQKLKRHAANPHAALLIQRALGDLTDFIGQNMEIFLKIGGIAQQHSHRAAACPENRVPKVLVGQLFHQPCQRSPCGRIGGRQLGGKNHHPGGVILPPQQTAGRSVFPQELLHPRGGIFGVLQHQRNQKSGLVPPLHRTAAQVGILVVNFGVNVLELRRQAVHGEGFEHIADDIVLDGLFGILKIIIAAQKRDVHGGADFPHLAGQLDARNKGHTDIGEQQVRFQAFHQFQRVQTVAGPPHKMKSQRFPGNHLADGIQQFLLVIRHNHSINGTFRHESTFLMT